MALCGGAHQCEPVLHQCGAPARTSGAPVVNRACTTAVQLYDQTEESMDMQSPDIDKLAGTLAKAQGAMQAAKFDKTMQGEVFVPLCHARIRARSGAQTLSDNGLAVVQTTVVEEGKLWLYTTLMHESGQFVRSVYPVIALQSVSPQIVGSALTYAKRYSFAAMVGVAGDEDDDGNLASQGQTGSGNRSGGSFRSSSSGRSQRPRSIASSRPRPQPARE